MAGHYRLDVGPDLDSTGHLESLCRGVELMARPLGYGLGPTRRVVLNSINGSPEVVTDSGTLVERINQLGEPGLNTGAMLLRQACAAVSQRHGDGAATTAVLARSLIRAGVRLVCAGAEPIAVSRGIDAAVATAVAALQRASFAATRAGDIARLIAAAIDDATLATTMGEMFEVLGADAVFSTADGTALGLDHEYVDGARWWARPGYPEVFPLGSGSLDVNQARVVCVDQELRTMAEVLPMLELATVTGRPVIAVCRDITGEALSTVQTNATIGRGLLVVPVVISPGQADDDLDDIAVCTGSVMIADVLGRHPRDVSDGWAGTVSRATLSRTTLTLTGGAGTAERRAQRCDLIRAHSAGLPSGKPAWHRQRTRIARLRETMGVIRIGPGHEWERRVIETEVAKAERIGVAALSGGLVPGGGVAHLGCQGPVRAAADQAGSDDEAAGMHAVAEALAAPLLMIIGNTRTGEPKMIMHRCTQKGPGYGFDALTGRVVDMVDAGVVDGLGVAAGALQAAGTLATMIIKTVTVVGATDARG